MRLREARVRAGLSQRDLAFPGCSPAYISRIEAGDRIPSLQLLREIGRRLGVSEDYLATGARDAEIRALLRDLEVAVRLDDRDRALELLAASDGLIEADADRSLVEEARGQLAYRDGDLAAAVDELELALELGNDPLVERPSLVEALARAYATRGELAPAIALLSRAAEAAKNEPVTFIRYSARLADAYTDNGSFAEAEQALALALERSTGISDLYTRARLYWARSRLLAESGEMPAAESYARQTLELLRATEDAYAVAHILETLAHICTSLDRADEALALLAEARPAIDSFATPEEKAHFRVEEARTLLALGRTDEAASSAMEAAGRLQETLPISAGRAFVLIAEVFEEAGEIERARELYELAIERLEGLGPTRVLVTAYKRLAEILKRLGRRDEALALLERAVGVQEQAGRPLR
jgi:tetratricopeptide (TPR) repeat protein